ncbi:MAG TPA: dTDP-4-dehydrorhamnose reductase [Hyphomicrobiaceae bacterium]|nr:dTDP-4-dehydrorhamnose reductase [Hyphomicrobiaceae bacterium]
MTKVLVIGRTGQVGHELMRARWPDGWSVTGTDRGEMDLAEPDTIRHALAQRAPDVIVNAAAYTAVDRAETDRDRAFTVNADALAIIGGDAAARNVPVLHISTDYVFDGSGTRPWRETDPTGPLGVYGASKLAGEHALLAAQPRSMILRTSWVYGVHGNNFVKTMLRLGGERDEVSVVDDQFGAPTAATDIAETLVVMAFQARLPPNTAISSDVWGVFHYSGAGETTWHGFAEHVFRHLETRKGRRPVCRPIPTSAYPTPARRPANSRLDCSRIARTFSVTPRNWREALDRVLTQLI